MMLYQLLQIFPTNQSSYPVNHPQKIKWLENFAQYLGLQQNFFYDMFSYVFIIVLVISIIYYFYTELKSKKSK